MAKQVYWLSDAEWRRIEPLLPEVVGARIGLMTGASSAVSCTCLHSGARWRDCPEAYGPYTTIYNRFNRWSRQGYGPVSSMR